jgi:hypothetical protein
MRTLYGFLVAVFVALLVIAAPVNVKASSSDCQQLYDTITADTIALQGMQDLNAQAVVDYNNYNGSNPAVAEELQGFVYQTALAVTNQLALVNSDLRAAKDAQCM